MPDTLVYPALTLLCVVLTTVRGRYTSTTIQCETRGSPRDMELTLFIMYNRGNFLSFNSTENKFIGYTEYGIKWAKDFNKSPQAVHEEARRALANCQEYEQQFQSLMDKEVKPEVVLSSMRSGSHDHPALLMCSAYRYYPKGIKVTWLRDGQVVTSDVSTTDELASGDWHYQVHSYLEYTPTAGEKISCMVEHQSLAEPVTYTWGRSLSQTERHRLGFGVAALLLGFITAASGLIYHRYHRTRRSGPTPGSGFTFIENQS